jgi:hypothetical protein
MEIKCMLNQSMGEGTEKENFFEKLKEYKKEIAIVAVTVFSKIMLVAINKATLQKGRTEKENPKNVITKFSDVEKSVTSNLSGNNVINVREHVRNLPKGSNPSVNKLELAEKYGYSLEEHQTWVNAYKR